MQPPAVFGPAHFRDYALLGRLVALLEDLQAQGLDKLPSESDLCRSLEVDRYQLHRLLQSLSREGMIYQVRAKGWFLQAEKLDVPVSRHNSYTTNMRLNHREPRSEVLGIDQVRAAGQPFWPDPEAWLWVLDYRRYVGPLAFSLARIQLPVDRTPGLQRHIGPNRSLYETLEAEYGLRPDRRRTWCEAVAADTMVADALGVPVGGSLLKATHEALVDGQPFELTVNYLRGDAARLRFDLVNGTEEPR